MGDNNIINIWKSFIEGDKQSFEYLYNLHVYTLFRYCTKFTQNDELVKDAIQEVFLDLYLKRKKNKTNPNNLKYYLILALKRNLIKKLIRNRKMVGEEIDELLFEPEYSIEKKIIEGEKDSETNLKVSKELNKLPAKQKEAVYLRYNESLDYSEIAKLQNISIESVRKQVYRALKTIRESFENVSLTLLLSFFMKK